MLSVLIHFLIASPMWISGMPDETCKIRISQDGQIARIEALANPQDWPSGNYTLTVQVKSGGNTSISRQGGTFNGNGKTEPLVLSVSAHLVASGGALVADLDLTNGARSEHCSATFNP